MVRPRPCLGGHCPELTTHPSSRCPSHRTAWERQRGSSTARGYDEAHKALREQWAPTVATGRVRCARCGKLIASDDAWDLGHVDGDRSRYSGPEHAGCNRGRRSPSAPANPADGLSAPIL